MNEIYDLPGEAIHYRQRTLDSERNTKSRDTFGLAKTMHLVRKVKCNYDLTPEWLNVTLELVSNDTSHNVWTGQDDACYAYSYNETPERLSKDTIHKTITSCVKCDTGTIEQ
jgi:hypothetical protein